MFTGSLALGAAFLFAFRGILSGEGLQRTNYRGVRLPTAAGVVFAPVVLVMWITCTECIARSGKAWSANTEAGLQSLGPGMNAMLVLVLGMCFVGFMDDAGGDREARGFRGHFSQVFRGTFTTGFMKALLGFTVSVAALVPLLNPGSCRSPGYYGRWLLGALVIALTANLFNLLDLAPARAMKAFFPATALCVGLTLRSGVLPVEFVQGEPLYLYVAPALCVAAVALVLLPGDLRERFMIGDTGSNVLGAVVGLGLVLGTSLWWRVGVMAALLALNLLSEKYSFSKLIASNRILSWLDSFGRQGETVE